MLIPFEDQAPRTVMAIFAHPDDAEISCFGLLSKLRKQGWRVVMIVVTRGENGADPSSWDRMNEARNATALLGGELVFGNFADGFVPRSGEIVNWIEELLDEHRPHLIVTHHTGESRTSHQDHVAVEAAVQIAVRRARWRPTLLLAEGIDQDMGFRPNWFVDITEEFQQKLEAIGMHVSQSGKYYMQPDYQALRAKKWGLNFPEPENMGGIRNFWEAYCLAQHAS